MASVISSIHDLQKLQTQKSWLLPGNLQVELNLKGLNEAENLDYQTRLNKFLNSCGCTSGAVFASLSGGFYLFSLFLNVPVLEIQFASILTLLAIFLAGGIIGKISGLIYSHLKLKRITRHLINRINTYSV